jgi:hypothetical protein
VNAAPAVRPIGKLIQCVVPDDGTDKRVLEILRDRMGIVAGHSMSCRSVAMVVDVEPRRGRLPPSQLARLVQIVTTEDQADAAFDLVFATAGLGRPGRGIVFQGPLLGQTTYELPGDVPDEAD